MTLYEPWETLKVLQNELSKFNDELLQRPQLIIANKLDLPEAIENFAKLPEHTSLPIIRISAKTGENMSNLLKRIREIYDSYLPNNDTNE